MARYIFVTGGVLSSLGKGIAAASLGSLLQQRGFSVKIRKLDPYLNCDPGTMSPYQHGEVYVTEDGAESDLDLGHYERFTNTNSSKADTITAGRIYLNVIERERRGDYLGATVQVVPHITDEIKDFIRNDSQDVDFLIAEIGGTVGTDIESVQFFEAIRQFGNDVGRDHVLYIHLTYLPYIATAGELKTKPTQRSVKDMLSHGIQPDILLCRTSKIIEDDEKKKIALFCNVPLERVISAPDVSSIYMVPINLHNEGLDRIVCKHFGLTSKEPDLSGWKKFTKTLACPEGEVVIGIVAKYSALQDAYKSLNEALIHAGVANNVRVISKWINAEDLSPDTLQEAFEGVHGILVPGGFGERGIKGKIMASSFARANKIPYFGICLGMQVAIIDIAQNLLNLKDASSTEFGPSPHPVVGLMTEWEKDGKRELRTESNNLGGTMRLGSYPCVLMDKTRIASIYKTGTISERHRHRYEVNTTYKNDLEKVGVVFSGLSPDGKLPEIIELKDHPWFIGVQFHPEYKSRPLSPHPVFVAFIQAALNQSRLV
ncbi:MAG: CTP synthase [Alphaproteobacteria bacterium]|nr:CTP synthase [Alphaproteobacteria bacterium]